MKSLLSLVLLAILGATSASAQDEIIRFTGKITQATKRYPDVVGRACSIEVTPASRPDAPVKQFNVVLKIDGVKGKRKAPLKKMFLYHGTDHVYEAGGGKYRGEMAQILRVTFDATETKVLRWTYVDGTEDWFMTYVCE